jgi:hypothetical protein
LDTNHLDTRDFADASKGMSILDDIQMKLENIDVSEYFNFL